MIMIEQMMQITEVSQKPSAQRNHQLFGWQNAEHIKMASLQHLLVQLYSVADVLEIAHVLAVTPLHQARRRH